MNFFIKRNANFGSNGFTFLLGSGFKLFYMQKVSI